MFSKVAKKDNDAPQFLSAEQIQELILCLNERKRNVLTEGNLKISANIKKKNLELLEAKKKRIDPAVFGIDGGIDNDVLLQALGAEGDNATDDMEDKFSLKIKQKIEDEDVHVKSMLHAIVSSKLSKSNNDNSAVPAGSIAPWSKPSEELLEYFYREGVSVDIGAAKGYADRLNGTLYFRFHIRQLACIQLNLFHYFFNRAYADVANLGITSTGVSEVRVNPETSTHWSNMEVKHMVRPEHIEKCFAYLETNFRDTFAKLKKCTTKPKAFNVEFEVWDSCMGLYTSVPAIRGAQCLEMYGYGGKNQKKFEDISNASDLSDIINNSGMDMSEFDDSKVSTKAGLDDALKSNSNSGDDVDVLASIKTNNNNMFDDLLNDKISGAGDSDAKDKPAAVKNMFVCDKKESVYDIMDSLVALAPCKGYENSKLMEDMVRFLNAKCEEVEDSIKLDDTEFIMNDQATCFNINSELAINMIVSNPVNLYRVATGLFVNLVCLRLRNISKRSRLLAGANNMYEYGSETNISYAPFTNCKFRLDKTNCECRNYCDCSAWADKVREDNARTKFGPRYEPDTIRRRHNSHRVISPNFLWLDKLEKQIHEIACKKMGMKLKPPQSITKTYDYLSCDPNALDTFNKCYPSAGLHQMFCNNVLSVRRPDFKTHFKCDKFAIQGRVNDPHNKDRRIKDITSMQAGNSEAAFEFSKENLELQPSDGMLTNANGRGCSIREYATRITALPMRVNELNKEMASSGYHPMAAVGGFKNKVADLMTDIGELIDSPLIAEALEHYKKSDATTNPDISPVSASKESRMMMKKYARYCLENKNVAFLMGINKMILYSVVYSLNGFRFSGSNYKEVGIHQFISSIKSAVVCGDYYSAYGDKSKDEQAAFNVMDDDNEEVEGEVIKKGNSKMDMFLCLSAQDLLLEDHEVEEEEMKEKKMKRKTAKEDETTKEIPVKSQRTSIPTTKVPASPDSRMDCKDDEFDFSA
nr:MAG: wsv285-like protein [Hemigrapsus takanoi nimavirus]